MKYKEFLNIKNGYTLEILPEHAGDDKESGLIEVPDGAELYAKSKDSEYVFFAKDNGGTLSTFSSFHKNEWHKESTLKIWNIHINYDILWQRHTKPESLPFVDDEVQSINDQYAEIEQVRQQSIDATLAERQSTYGGFVHVANTTGKLFAEIKNGKNAHMLPYAHEEALHMICSKIARIVNGNCNHKDSWHDIGGYAKLIENLINESNNG